jgi:PAS domain S-box-containing protein
MNANRNVRKDGSVIYCEWYISALQDGAGRLSSVLSFVLDVTSRKRAEDALRDEEKKYRSLFENSLDAVYLTRQDGTILDANRAACAMHGMSLEEIKQRGRSGLVVNDDRHAAALEARRATGQVRAEMTDLRKDGSQFPVEVESVVVDPVVPDAAAFVIARDISERKRAEEGLREAVQRYERQVRLFDRVASTTPDFVYLFDLQGRFLYANRRLLEVLGMQLEDVIGRTCRELGYEQWHHDMHMREIAQVIETKRAIKGEVPFKAPLTGVFGVYEYIFTPVAGPDGEVEIVAGTTRDVTERKRAEDALREADRRKSEFLAVLSHELRNPLAPIRNSIYLLERAPPGSEQATRARDVVRRQTEHLTRLVDDHLDVTRISRGKINLLLTRLDLREVVRKTTDDVRSVFAQAGVELRVDHVLGPIWIDADATRISQVLGNLLHNSVKFTPAGGVVTVSIATSDGCAELSVRDTGIGMDPAQIDRMFEPFAQADQTLARPDGGLGLGLALVKGLVELHEGTVEARTGGIGRGAEFLVRLRLANGAAEKELELPAAVDASWRLTHDP